MKLGEVRGGHSNDDMNTLFSDFQVMKPRSSDCLSSGVVLRAIEARSHNINSAHQIIRMQGVECSPCRYQNRRQGIESSDRSVTRDKFSYSMHRR
jgi:hypothetical protein